MKKQQIKKRTLICSFILFSTLLLITPIHTLAIQPENVDVTIRIADFDTLYKDKDVTSAGDVYFKIIHDTGTEESGTAWNDYEDEGDYDLSNTDFDGNGYYDEQYWNVDLDTGDLTWIIEVWDEDNVGGDDLLFRGTLTIKDPGTSGSHSNDNVIAYDEWIWSVYLQELIPWGFTTNTDYLRFQWDDGPHKQTSTWKISNGLILWISLYYSI
ncbi:MAG: hypothetical protein GPJ51_08900 [Candidatus Heimdallarchaeota archaeon]|nr:hypothetical protein [Candidatus Heimdallarchaeota archaeon]